MAHAHVSWMSPQGSFKLRAAVLFEHEGQVLLCRVDEKPGWYLPGGKVRLGEATRVAAQREFREESGLEVELGDLFLVSEGVHTQMGVQHHEICYYYRGAWPGGSEPNLAEAPIARGHTFQWVSLHDLEAKDFRPLDIAAALGASLLTGAGTGTEAASAEPPMGVRHVTYRRVVH
ncbi:NUDIX domain-containing protein [Micrococcales bacterium 31B]|nr:NUDIX domain-containing protein [Micrococcales bacterium 31B]